MSFLHLHVMYICIFFCKSKTEYPDLLPKTHKIEMLFSSSLEHTKHFKNTFKTTSKHVFCYYH